MWTLAHQLVTDINPPISVRIRPQAHQLNMLSTWPSISPSQSPVSTEYKRWKFLFYYCFPMVSRINQTFVFLPQENNNSLNKVNPSSVSPKCVIRLNDIRNKTWELNILPMFGRAENATCTTNPPRHAGDVKESSSDLHLQCIHLRMLSVQCSWNVNKYRSLIHFSPLLLYSFWHQKIWISPRGIVKLQI